MSEQQTESSSLPLHVKILIAMVIGTIVGVWANPGEVDVSSPVSGSITETDGAVTLLETTTAPDGSVQELYSVSFSSQEEFARSFPELMSLVRPGKTTDVDVSGTRARLSHSMKGVSVTWQRSHNGNPIVTTFGADSVADLAPAWRRLAEDNPAGVAETVVTLAKAIADGSIKDVKGVGKGMIKTMEEHIAKHG